MLKQIMAVTTLALAVVVVPAAATQTAKLNSAGATTLDTHLVELGEGFHTCDNPSAAGLEDWYSDTPFYGLGLYLGGHNGSVVGCTDIGSTKWQDAATDGFRLFPYYYSYQMPTSCGGSSSVPDHFSLTTSTAESQGEGIADNAASAAASHQLGVGATIYLDLESFGDTSDTCLKAAEYFVEGWDRELALNTNYWGGLYGSSEGSALSSFGPSHLAYPPVAIAPDDTGDSPHGVYGLLGLPDSMWDNHQRIHQSQAYQSRTFNGYTMTVDGDCLDGPVVSSINLTLTPGNCAAF